MSESNEFARLTWCRQLRKTGIKREDIIVALEQLQQLQCRDNELLLQISNGKIDQNSKSQATSSSSVGSTQSFNGTSTSTSVSSQCHLAVLPPVADKSITNFCSSNNKRSSSYSDSPTNNPLRTLPVHVLSQLSVTPIPSQSSNSPRTSKACKEFALLDETGKQLKIREFMAANDFSDRQVSELTRIKLHLLQRYFEGDFKALSEEVKQILFTWYAVMKSDSKRVQEVRNQIESVKRKQAELIPVKRDRFIFRKQHLEVLEKAFKTVRYPDLYAKEDIARECNEAVERAIGTTPSELVTVSVVANWFNNKRKEEKRNKRQRTSDWNCNGGTNSMETESMTNESSISYVDSNYAANESVPEELEMNIEEIDPKDITEIVVDNPASNSKKSECTSSKIEDDEEDVEEIIIPNY
ncbi:homeobox-containing protein 1-like protein [Leptotrombidium deliense]|uniref:Homeobox-containing protein 1-like protein n=1 Tax=Leptotrombidium deliense TaxID=299467 RepID=A0A443SU84_9ACAR|nr:homeobox-containing protein 1-like protein [Leptotrombidium deliense]